MAAWDADVAYDELTTYDAVLANELLTVNEAVAAWEAVAVNNWVDGLYVKLPFTSTACIVEFVPPTNSG